MRCARGTCVIYSGVVEDPVSLTQPAQWSGKWEYRPTMRHSNQKCDIELPAGFCNSESRVASQRHRLQSVRTSEVVHARSQNSPQPCDLGSVVAADDGLIDLPAVLEHLLDLNARLLPLVSGVELP